jgi:hypothetical protein
MSPIIANMDRKTVRIFNDKQIKDTFKWFIITNFNLDNTILDFLNLKNH